MKSILSRLMLGVCLWPALCAAPIRGDETEPDAQAPADSDDEKLRQAAERFLDVLEKNPRRGTALDRLYGYHVEAGTLETFVKRFEERAAKNPKDGAAWMIVGLIESQRGHDASAVAAFQKAEQTLPDNPLAPFYLGQSLVLVGQPDEAAAAFERAIARKPARADLLDLFQALGRVYQRAQKNDQALAVWNRLEKLFPDDLRVQEQIATTLVEEGQHAQALPRFEALAAKVKDEYRAATFRVEAADLKVRLGQSPAALADFEALLNKLNPDNWLYRDIRRRIEEVFLKTDDQAGLATYYEGWVQKNAEDVDAMGRLARILAGLGRTPEAQSWLDKALKLAPSRKDLRLAFIEQLLAEKQYGKGIEQYELLAKNDPNNPDLLREWGRLILKDSSKPEAERKKSAAAVWQKLVVARPKDSLTATQVADLFRQSEMTEEALALYKKAIELSPDATQYREYLGEYYHTLQRRDEALATWREIIAGKKRTPENLARLAEVLAGFGYLEEAVQNIQAACKLDDDEFKYPLKAAELLSRSEKYDDALKQLDAAEKLADSPENGELVLQQRIRNLQLADKLEERIGDLQKELADEKAAAKAERWYLLARYLESARKLPEADRAIGKALALEEKSVPYRTTAARIAESSGNLQGAADVYRLLAQIDRRFRTEHLTQVAKLETQLGRTDQALQAGRDLLAAAPGNPDNYEFFAQLCFQLGKAEEGLNALRRSVRLNPNDASGIIRLAAALADRMRIDEAIEIYWRAFEKSKDLEGKLAVVSKLADLHIQTNRFERLVERFERDRREAGQAREMTMCLAQAHESAGDYGTARQELERLLANNARDTQLLHELSKLAEKDGDLEAATRFQEQLTHAAPGREAELRLALLFDRLGETDDAVEIWKRLTAGEDDPVRLLGSLDNLLAHDKRDLVATITERLLHDQPQNWEILYRRALALVDSHPEEAARQFQAILALRNSDDEPGGKGKAREKTELSRVQLSGGRALQRDSFPLPWRLQEINRIRSGAGQSVSSSRLQGQVWFPGDFGQARIAALTGLLRMEERAGTRSELVSRLRQAAERPEPDSRDLWDWYYLQRIQLNQAGIRDAARRLARLHEPQGEWLYLTSIVERQALSSGRVPGLSADESSTAPPLSDSELDDVLASYRSLAATNPELLTEMGIVSVIMTELKRAGRPAEADEVYRALVAVADRPQVGQRALQLAAAQGDIETALVLFDKVTDEQLAGGARPSQPTDRPKGVDALLQLMSARGAEGAYPDVLRLFERYLSFSHRRRQSSPASVGLLRRKPARSNTARPTTAAQARAATLAARSKPLPDFPPENDCFDEGGIRLLRKTFEIYRQDDLLDDLFAHFRKRIDATPESERLFWHLGLAYLCVWDNDADQALAQMQAAIELAPADPNLRFELANLYERYQEFELALQTLNEIVAADQQVLVERETAVLRLALLTKTNDRARQAAERLYGMRLDRVAQQQLVGQMQQLGMNDYANSLLSRTQRQADSRGSSLTRLVNQMSQYLAEQKIDQAVQLAQQVLKRSPAANAGSMRIVTQTRSTSTGVAGGTVVTNSVAATSRTAAGSRANSVRQIAQRVLQQSGQLDDLIARAEGQLAASPDSTSLFQTLVDYYEAAGRGAKIVELCERRIAARPDDAKLHARLAVQLTQSSQFDAAVKHYSLAIRKDPAIFGQDFALILQVFKQASRTDDLLSLLGEVDFSKVGNVSAVFNVAQNLLQNDPNIAVSVGFLRRACKAYPAYRPTFFSMIARRTNSSPEFLDFVREFSIPGRENSLAGPWGYLDQAYQYGNDGRASGMLTQLVDAAAGQKRLAELQQEVEQAIERFPEWSGGKALLAVIYARSGVSFKALPLVEQLLADRQNPVPVNVAWMVAQELDDRPETRPAALALYQSGVTVRPFNVILLRRLATTFQQAGDLKTAHDLLLEAGRARPDERYPPTTLVNQRMQNVNAVGPLLVEIGYPLDAVRLYSEALADDEFVALASRIGNNQQQALPLLRQSLASALNTTVTARCLPNSLDSILAVRAPADRKPGQPALDLQLQTEYPDLKQLEVISVAENVIRAAATSAELKETTATRLEALLAEYSDDPTVHIAAGIAAFAGNQPEARMAAVERLTALLERVPLAPLPAGEPINSQKRAEAGQWVGLWLIARRCLNSEEYQAAGARFAARAVAGAQRQLDRRFQLALFREWGQILYDGEDKTGAADRWTEMLAAVLPAGSHIVPLVSVAKDDVPGDDAAPADVPLRKNRALTVLQCKQALEIARLAGERGLPELSLRAVREALQSGPPIAPPTPDQGTDGVFTQVVTTANGTPQVVRTMRNAEPSEQPNPNQLVATQISNLWSLWTRLGIPAADRYETLAGIVFPEGRPREICLYSVAPGPVKEGVGAPTGASQLARLLVTSASDAGRIDDLQRRIAVRQEYFRAKQGARTLQSLVENLIQRQKASQ